MILGAHAILYAKDAQRARAFFRDVLGLRSVDAGEGWLIFALPPAEMGIHPDEESGRHELHLMVDDVEATVKRLEAKGVRFTAPIVDRGYGLVTAFEIPGGGEIGMYEPRHPTAIRWKARARAKRAPRAATRAAKPKRGAKRARRGR